MPFHKSPFTGFPFDEDCDNRAESPFRSQLDDIAARHPEFAQHLGSFPFRSSGITRSHIPEQFTHQRFQNRPFGDRFEEFGFPFEEHSENREQKPYHQRYPQYYHTATPQENTGEQSSSNQDCSRKTSESDANIEQSDEPRRSRRPKQNIQQSNTVDLGQKLEPVDDRSQRSMSAPPSNNRPRFVSSINIPINQPSANNTVTRDDPQSSIPSQPQERVIPIHVEGRDEPVIPKGVASQNSHPQAQAHPCSDKFFTQRSPNFSQYFQREQHPFQNEWLPRGFSNKQSNSSNSNQGQAEKTSQSQPKPESSPSNVTKQTAHEQNPMQTDEGELNERSKTQEYKNKFDPIDQIKLIQKDVSELLSQVDQFSGKPRDKQYLYLDEMLTRNLIKLDNIDTQGQENIRLARKEAIKCIEKAISILESKANANIGDQKVDTNMETETLEQIDENKEKELDTLEAEEQKKLKDTEDENTSELENKMEVENTENIVENEGVENPMQTMVSDSPESKVVKKTAEQVKDISETEKNPQFQHEKQNETEEMSTCANKVKDCHDLGQNMNKEGAEGTEVNDSHVQTINDKKEKKKIKKKSEEK